MTGERFFLGDKTVSGDQDVCERGPDGGYVVHVTIPAHSAGTVVRLLNQSN